MYTQTYPQAVAHHTCTHKHTHRLSYKVISLVHLKEHVAGTLAASKHELLALGLEEEAAVGDSVDVQGDTDVVVVYDLRGSDALADDDAFEVLLGDKYW